MVKYLKISSAVLSLMLLAACGEDKSNESPKDSEAAETSSNSETSAEDTTNEATTNDKETEEEESEVQEVGAASGEIFNPNIAKQSEGNVEVIYTNENPGYLHDMDGFKVSVDAYQIVKVTDMNTDFYIEFDDQTEGYVITAKVTVENTINKTMNYPLNMNIQLTGPSDYIHKRNTFVRDEYPKSATEKVTKWAAGEKVTGLVTFTLTNDDFKLLDTVKPKFVIEGGVADNDQFSGSYKGNAIFDFTYNEVQAEAVASAHVFYPDRLTTDNMADKELIFENMAINETQQLADVKVTLEGIQYTEIIPTKAHEDRFRNFGDNGIVALTAKFIIDNQSSEKISITNLSSKVTIDQNRGNVFAQGMVEPNNPRYIEAGEQGEKYHVFLFRKDEFEIFKRFDLEFGPFVQDDGKKQFKGHSVIFSLPR
ncbi:DUF5068 domain-containing protein [Solibacillus sp. CAU 1738]|uniref:DUF5068 domain-containing protein n=1 Tax=Solibacillus sp. CAU 1738 TaxID=3140363 RepID=UPI0032609F90